MVIVPWSGTSGEFALALPPVLLGPPVARSSKSFAATLLTHVHFQMTRRRAEDRPPRRRDGANSDAAVESAHSDFRGSVMFGHHNVSVLAIESGFSIYKIEESKRCVESSFTADVSIPKTIDEIEWGAHATSCRSLPSKQYHVDQ